MTKDLSSACKPTEQDLNRYLASSLDNSFDKNLQILVEMRADNSTFFNLKNVQYQYVYDNLNKNIVQCTFRLLFYKSFKLLMCIQWWFWVVKYKGNWKPNCSVSVWMAVWRERPKPSPVRPWPWHWRSSLQGLDEQSCCSARSP